MPLAFISRTRNTYVLRASAALGLVLAALLWPVRASAAPLEISCGEVLTEDVVLENDLTDCPGAALVIGADRITVDLDGHTVSSTCATFCPGMAVIDNRGGYDRVRILDGTVQSSRVEIGIALANADRNTLEALTVFRFLDEGETPGVGISLSNSDRNSLQGSTVEGGDPAVLLSGSERNEISRSSIEGSIDMRNGDAIRMLDSDRNTLVESEIDARASGLIIVDSIRNRITHNRLGSYAVPLVLGNADRTRISGNVIATGPPGTPGIEMYSSSDANLIRGNEVWAPVRIEGDRNRVERNEVDVYVGTGIEVRSGASNLLRNNIAANTIDGDAIAIGSAATDTMIKANLGTNAIDDGIDVDAPGTIIRGNTATDNGDWGIEAVAGVIDAGGNRASGNGNPLQCLNVICR